MVQERQQEVTIDIVNFLKWINMCGNILLDIFIGLLILLLICIFGPFINQDKDGGNSL